MTEPRESTEVCSNCGRDCRLIVYCAECRRELLCGDVAEPCTQPGCVERRIQERYNDAGYCFFLEDVNPERLLAPRRTDPSGQEDTDG